MYKSHLTIHTTFEFNKVVNSPLNKKNIIRAHQGKQQHNERIKKRSTCQFSETFFILSNDACHKLQLKNKDS